MLRPSALITMLALAAGVTAASCTIAAEPGASAITATASPRTTPTAQSAGSARPSIGTGASAAPTAAPPSTTDTTWGRIWDGLPTGFPWYPAAEPAAASEGPASGTLSVAAKPAAVAGFYEKALRGAGYDIEALAGPMEDGSTTIDAVGSDPGCRVQVAVAPRGGLSLVTILFAAACPYR